MPRTPYHLPLSGEPETELALALEIAIGCSLPDLIENWPIGLSTSWNDAAEAGAFSQAKTIGAMARAFLEHRLAGRAAGLKKAAA